MNFLPEFNFSLSNAFWISILFIATNIIVIKRYPKHYKERVLSMPKFHGRVQQITGTLNFFLFQGLIAVTFFIKLQFNLLYFAPGAVLFVVGYFAYLHSLIDYATSNPQQPVTKGIYRFSRNPQQLATILMWTGTGFMTGSGLIICICLFQLITVYPTFTAQEKYCLYKYGDEYKKYMNKTARYFSIPK